MSGVTGIELGPDFCVLVRGGRPGSHRTVSAASSVMPSAWPHDPQDVVERLREARERHELPSRARVVAWDGDASLAPLTEAGFEIVSVLTPAQALARVAHARQVGAPAGTAVAAVSLNSHGAAIAIVAGTEVVYSRLVEWPLGTPFTGARSELLDRYLLVSQIAPQLQHVIDLVKPVNGVTVTSVLACGNLPDLRSLAMLLIEEMDIEVETLDSTELLDSGAPGTSGESVASLQIAAAVASSGENRVPVHVPSEPAPEASASAAEPSGYARASRFQHLAALAVATLCASWSFMQVAGSSPAVPIFPVGIDTVLADATPERPELRAEATVGRVQPVAIRVPPGAHRRALPSVDGILIAGTRRLAIVGGTVVATGDTVGTRAVARIDRDGVVLREPTGTEVYVAIRSRKPPTLGS